MIDLLAGIVEWYEQDDSIAADQHAPARELRRDRPSEHNADDAVGLARVRPDGDVAWSEVMYGSPLDY